MPDISNVGKLVKFQTEKNNKSLSSTYERDHLSKNLIFTT